VGRPGGRHCSHSGRRRGKPQPLRATPEDCGTVLALRRSAAFAPRHRSLPLGIRRADLAGRPREIRLAAVVAAEAVAAHTAVDEHIQLERATALKSGKSTISSFSNLAWSHPVLSQVRAEVQTPVRHQCCAAARLPIRALDVPLANRRSSGSGGLYQSLMFCKFLCWVTNALPRWYRAPCRRPTSRSRPGAGSALPERARRHRCAQLPS